MSNWFLEVKYVKQDICWLFGIEKILDNISEEIFEEKEII